MTPHPYLTHLLVHHPVTPDWRWRRVEQRAAGDPDAGRHYDDAVTLRAAEARRGAVSPALDDVRAAWGVWQAGGPRRQLLEAYLFTALTAAEVGGRTGLTEPVVNTYEALFFAVRGPGPAAGRARRLVEASGDPLVRAARFGPLAVPVRAAMEAGAVPAEWVELAERLERSELLYRLGGRDDPAAYRRAADRLLAIQDAGRWPPRRRRPRPG